MDFGTGIVRHVDILRRALLHRIHSSLGCHSNRQVNDHPSTFCVQISTYDKPTSNITVQERYHIQ